MNDLYIQFLTIATVHLFAVMSPGPDFAIILKQSICNGRKASLLTSIGIGTGITMHIMLCMFGLGMVISESKILFDTIKILGGIYLFYIGIRSLVEKVEFQNYKINESSYASLFKSFQLGFLTNVLNPKATLFFLSLYATIITDQTTLSMQALYGLWMALITSLWFCLLSIILTSKSIVKKIQRFVGAIQKGTGIVLIAFAIKLLFTNQ
tara:strand:+ start:421 stop:1047 length:627 start_codon:yes stop_codon:yes gene_type:complete